MKRTVCALIAILSSAVAFADTEAKPAPLVLESKISLGAIRGRVDHLAVDVARQRLLVAELEHDSIGVVDLKQHTLTRRLNGFRQPQGIAYEPETDTVYVTNAGDGSVHLLRRDDLTSAGSIELAEDADISVSTVLCIASGLAMAAVRLR
jgi:DNA-binding beta-propeller fold protein YncE